MDKTATIYHRDDRERTVNIHEAYRLVGNGSVGANKEWSLHKPPPLNWEFETPKYRVTRDTKPAERARYRSEPPFEKIWDSDVWQYGERPIMRGEIIETKEWPNASSFFPLNYAAKKVLEFFNLQMKSRLPRSPWHGDRLRLDNGLANSGIRAEDAATPRLRRMDLSPI